MFFDLDTTKQRFMAVSETTPLPNLTAIDARIPYRIVADKHVHSIGDLIDSKNDKYMVEGIATNDLLLCDGSTLDVDKYPLLNASLNGIDDRYYVTFTQAPFVLDSADGWAKMYTAETNGGKDIIAIDSANSESYLSIIGEGTVDERIRTGTGENVLLGPFASLGINKSAERFTEMVIDLTNATARLMAIGTTGGCIMVSETEIVVCSTMATGVTDSTWIANNYYGQDVERIAFPVGLSNVTLAFDIEFLEKVDGYIAYNVWIWVNGVAHPTPVYVVCLVEKSQTLISYVQLKGNSLDIRAIRSLSVAPYSHGVDYTVKTLPWQTGGLLPDYTPLDANFPKRIVADLTS